MLSLPPGSKPLGLLATVERRALPTLSIKHHSDACCSHPASHDKTSREITAAESAVSFSIIELPEEIVPVKEKFRVGGPNPLIARPWFPGWAEAIGGHFGEKKECTKENRELGASRLAGPVSDLLAESSLFETDLGVFHL